jgi:hypothetical protein
MSTLIASSFIAGSAKTKGSLNGYNGNMVEAVAGSKTWLLQVRDALQADSRRRGHTRPVRGHVRLVGVFYLPVLDVTAAYCGDLDKLLRNVGDALQSRKLSGLSQPIEGWNVIHDDVQISGIRSMKVSAPATSTPPGALVSVELLDRAEVLAMEVAAREAYALSLRTAQEASVVRAERTATSGRPVLVPAERN